MSSPESSSDELQEPKRASIGIVQVLILAAIVVYDVAGVIFLSRDEEVASHCRASNIKMHIIWPTTLWHYVAMSLVVTTVVGVFLALFVPVGRSNEELRWHIADMMQRNQSPRLMPMMVGGRKFGLALPDWLLLSVGVAFVGAGIVVGLMAFWGYFEIFATRVWCDDKKTAFEELDLWKFARQTFLAQVSVAPVLFVVGFLHMVAPFFMELTLPSVEDEFAYP